MPPEIANIQNPCLKNKNIYVKNRKGGGGKGNANLEL